jgi:carbon monoxide dehydrogenase subunit G
MPRIESEIVINRPAEQVFAFLSVPENHARFIPGMLEFKQTSPGALDRVGATARGLRRDLGIKTDVLYEITEVAPNSKLGMQGRMGPVRFKDGYVLEPSGAGVRVKFWLELSLSGPMKLAGPFVNLIGRTHAAETLANLRKSLEVG